MAPRSAYLAALLSIVPLVAGHGHVSGIVADGVWYTGWNSEMKYESPIPTTAGWPCDNLDNGFVSPTSFSGPDIICHKSATNGQAYVTVKAGDQVTFQWNTWPTSHKGPVTDYIASCGTDCTTVDKTTLKWVKMDAGGWISGSDPGTWATDTLIANNISWTITIPPKLAAGNYVIRHEIIALHAASSSNGAQAYPQCMNFKITGGGSETITGGVSAEAFYTATDPGILFNLYTSFSSYTIPGPAVTALKRRGEAVREHMRDWLKW